MASLEKLAPRVVVLCGSLRAGTTLLRVLLGRHPELTGRGENDYLFERTDLRMIRGGGTQAEREALRSHVAVNRIPKSQGVVPPALAPIPDMIAQMIEAAMPTEGRLLLTLHRHADLAAAALPGAAFVRLRRDPRDVAISAMKMGWAGNPFYGVDSWRQAERDWYSAEPLIAGPRSEIAFEAMTADPRGELSRVLGEIGLPFHEAVLTPHQASTYAPPSPERNYAWRGVLSEREAREIDWRIRDVPDDGLYDRRPLEPGTLRRLALMAQSKAGRHAFHARRYGLGLHIAKVATARLPIPGRAAVRERVNAIDTAHLK